jgi:DNA-binding MarR family transcriptional regulator
MSDHTATSAAPALTGDMLRLGVHLCFNLQNASRAFRGAYRIILQDTGLTYPQYLVMVALWEHGGLSVKRLGELLRLDSGTLSPLLKRLETMGLITRVRSRTDERSVLIDLTGEGQDMRAVAQRIPTRILAATGMDIEALGALQSTLLSLTDNLDSAVARGDL